MNESLFFAHSFFSLVFLFFALFLGKEAVMLFVASCWVFANFFVTKQILFFGFEITAADAYTLGAMCGISLLVQQWGKKAAQKTMWYSFFLLTFFLVMGWIHRHYIPGPHDIMHPHFDKLLSSTPRIIIASLIAFFVSGRLEIFLLDYFGRKSALSFALRSFCATAISAACDTLLFAFIGMYGQVFSCIDICIVSFLVKVSVLFLYTPFLALAQYVTSRTPSTD